MQQILLICLAGIFYKSGVEIYQEYLKGEGLGQKCRNFDSWTTITGKYSEYQPSTCSPEAFPFTHLSSSMEMKKIAFWYNEFMCLVAYMLKNVIYFSYFKIFTFISVRN